MFTTSEGDAASFTGMGNISWRPRRERPSRRTVTMEPPKPVPTHAARDETSVSRRKERLEQLQKLLNAIADVIDAKEDAKEEYQRLLREGLTSGTMAREEEDRLIEAIHTTAAEIKEAEKEMDGVRELARQVVVEKYGVAATATAGESGRGRVIRESGMSAAEARALALEEQALPDTFWMKPEELAAIRKENKKWEDLAREDPDNAKVYLSRVRDVSDNIAMRDDSESDYAYLYAAQQGVDESQQYKADMLAASISGMYN